MTSSNGTGHSAINSLGNTQVSPGILCLALAAAGCVAFFWDGIVSLLDAWSRPEYSHGPLIPLIAGYLFLRELRNRPSLAEPGTQVPGLLIFFLGFLVGLVGNLTQIPYLITYGLILVIGGLVLLVAGARQGARFWAPLLYLLFMLPLPNFMYWILSVKLQFLSSRLGVEFIQTLGIPVFLDGNIIDLGIYKLQVAEACSGLRYLFPLASFGFLFAVLYQGPFWHKVILFLSSMPITILMNSLRIGMIGILVNYFGIAQADGFLHWFEGWIIFGACIVLLYIEAIVLQRLVRKPRSTLNLLDLNFVGILTPLRAVPNIFAGKKLITAALLLFISGSVWQLLPERAAPKLERQTFSSFPLKINNWQGVPGPKLDPIIAQVLGADDYLTADYIAAGDQAQVNLFIAYYNSTTDGTGIHSPEICIPGSGWEVLSWQQAKVETGDAAIPAFTVNRAIIQKGGIKRLVYYWFEQRGRRLASEYTTKLITVWDSFTRARADGALVRFVTPLSRGEPESLADKRLTSFLSSFIRIIPDYIPQ